MSWMAFSAAANPSPKSGLSCSSGVQIEDPVKAARLLLLNSYRSMTDHAQCREGHRPPSKERDISATLELCYLSASVIGFTNVGITLKGRGTESAET